MMDDITLYKRLLNLNVWGMRGFTFDDEELFNKSKKFLKYLGYEIKALELDEKPKYHIHLCNYIVLPCTEKQHEEFIHEYQKKEQNYENE